MMADVQKTVEIIFGAVDNASSSFTTIGNNLNDFKSDISSVTGPIAGLTEDLIKTEVAVIALAAAYGGYAISESIKFENAQIDLQKVLSDTDPQIGTFTETVIDLSEQYGVASASILQGIANFKQAGFTAKESARLQKDALDLIIAGEVGAAEATEILISSLKGFGAEATEATRFIEALNNVSNVYATDLGELASGMASISPIASTMGFTFEETTGLITPIIEVFRSGDEAANALKTGLLKLTDSSIPVQKALASIGISQFDLNGEMRAGKDIYYDVAVAFQTLDENQKLVITSQLVGIAQAGKMVTVFDNLALSQDVTAVAMEKTGSVTEEVSLRLASASKQIDILVVSFNNLAKSVGDELKPAFSDSVDGLTTLSQAFRDVVAVGGLSDLFDELDIQGVEFKTFLEDIAKALPEAFEDLDFTGALDSFSNLKEAISGLFGDLDLTKPEDLQKVLQRLVDFLTLMTNATSGAVEGLEPLIDGIVKFLEYLANSDSDTQTFIGNIGGMVTSIDKLLPLLGFAADAITAVGIAIIALKGKGATELFGSIATKLTSISPTNVALAAAIGSITFAINENIEAYNKLKTAEDELLATQEHSKETQEKIAFRLEGISIATGVLVRSMEELNQAVDDGKLKFDEATGTYISTKKEVADYGVVVEKVVADSITWADSTVEAKTALEKLGVTVDDSAAKTKASAEEMKTWKTETDALASIMLQAAQAGRSFNDQVAFNAEQASAAGTQSNEYQRVLINGVSVFIKVGDATKEMSSATKTAVDVLKDLTDSERLVIEQTHELETTLLELASNEKIAAMEFTAEINVAQINAQAKQVEAAFSATASVINSLSEGVTNLYAIFATVGQGDRISKTAQAILEAAKRQEQRLDDELELKRELTLTQIRALEAQNKALNRETKVIIESSGLEKDIEAFMFEILKRIQLKVVGDRTAFLLGIGAGV